MIDIIAGRPSVVGVATLTVVVTLAALGAVYLLARVGMRLMRLHTTAPAGLLFAQAVAPTMIASVVALGIVLPAFVRFEPPHDGEPAGVLLLALAAISGSHLARMMFRAARMLTASRSLTAAWLTSAAPLADARWGPRAFSIDAGFPVVAVAGLFRPRLFVDRRVLDTCSVDELDAIAAHERAHVRRRDNLRRLLVGAWEGPESVTAAAWREAAERAADTQAATSPRRAVDLASALVKMARLAAPRTLERTALSTINDGGALEARVRHLIAIERAAPAERPLSLTPLALVAFAGVIGLNWSALLRSAHMLTESAVRYLP
jgi:Zn-dependent protease with chaperone function